MAWFDLSDIPQPDADKEALERARAVQRYAQMVLKLQKSGVYDPERTALARAAGMDSAEQLEDVADSAVFSAPQRAAIKKLARRLRAYSRHILQEHIAATGAPPLPAHKHKRKRKREPTEPRIEDRTRPTRITDVPISGWELDGDDLELGFLPALMPLITSVAGPLLGGLFGGGSKESAPAPAPAAAPAPAVMQAPMQATSNVTLPAIGGVIADQIRAVPPPVRQQVVDALRESMDRYKSGQQDATQLMTDIKNQLGPTIKAQLEAVNQAALQRQATFEHESIKQRDERWKANADAQQRILARMDEMESKLGNAVVGQNAKNVAIGRAFGIPTKLLR